MANGSQRSVEARALETTQVLKARYKAWTVVNGVEDLGSAVAQLAITAYRSRSCGAAERPADGDTIKITVVAFKREYGEWSGMEDGMLPEYKVSGLGEGLELGVSVSPVGKVPEGAKYVGDLIPGIPHDSPDDYVYFHVMLAYDGRRATASQAAKKSDTEEIRLAGRDKEALEELFRIMG